MTQDQIQHLSELADAIEEGLQGDGIHIGITDSGAILKALREKIERMQPETPEAA